MDRFEWDPIERVTVAGPDPGGQARWRGTPSATQLRDSTLLVAYREGADHWITPDGVVRLCRSEDGGKTWSAPQTILSAEGRGFGCHIGMIELDDGTILQPVVENHAISGRLPFFEYYQRMLISSYVIRSEDSGRTWSEPHRIEFGSDVIWTGSYGNVLLREDGQLLMCVAWQESNDTHYSTGLLRSPDNGRTWGHRTLIAVGVDDEKSICRLASKDPAIQSPFARLVAVLRDYDLPSKISYSDDGGETWSPVRSLPFHGQSPSLLYTQSGVLLCAYRERAPGKPHGVGLSYSRDGGQTWEASEPLYVSELRDCAYPNLLEISPGEFIAVYYTAAKGTKPLGRQDFEQDFEKISPELRKYSDPDNSIELVRFRQRT